MKFEKKICQHSLILDFFQTFTSVAIISESRENIQDTLLDKSRFCMYSPFINFVKNFKQELKYYQITDWLLSHKLEIDLILTSHRCETTA